MAKTVLIDFDGVIHSYVSGWKGDVNIPDVPNDSAIYKIQEYIDAGLDVVVFSTRAKTEAGKVAIKFWLANHGLRDDIVETLKITSEKVLGVLIIDDRGFRYRGQFPSVEFINDFKPWTKNDPDVIYNVAVRLYNRYSTSTGGVSAVTGDRLPEFTDCPTPVKSAWYDVAGAVIRGEI